MRIVSAIVVSSVIALPALAQRDWSKVEIKATPVAGTVYMLEGAGGNIGVTIGEDGIVIIDDQFAPLAPKIKEAVAGLSDKPVKFVQHTHWHGDHTGGNEYFGEIAPLVSHDNVRKRLAEGMDTESRQTPPAPPEALPILTFNDRLTIHLNGEEVRAIHLPHAHTDGDAVIWFTDSNVVHMGDVLFSGLFPFIDIDSGGSVDGVLAAFDTIVATVPADVKVIAGHGPLSTIDDIRKSKEMIVATREIIRTALSEGMTAEQMKEGEVLAKYDAWNWSFISTERWIDTLVRDLEGR
jgi:glyoxylase-like metal-dependent hydrolase (beta-lactamase superfamily II)